MKYKVNTSVAAENYWINVTFRSKMVLSSKQSSPLWRQQKTVLKNKVKKKQ